MSIKKESKMKPHVETDAQYEKRKMNLLKKDTLIVAKIVEWLDANVDEQSLLYEVRLESARLRDRIETWRHEL